MARHNISYQREVGLEPGSVVLEFEQCNITATDYQNDKGWSVCSGGRVLGQLTSRGKQFAEDSARRRLGDGDFFPHLWYGKLIVTMRTVVATTSSSFREARGKLMLMRYLLVPGGLCVSAKRALSPGFPRPFSHHLSLTESNAQ